MTAGNLAAGVIAAAIAVFAGFQVAATIDDAVPRDRWLPGITLPGVTTPQVTVPDGAVPEQSASEAGRPGRAGGLRVPMYSASTFREVLRRMRASGATRVSSLRVDADDVVALARARGRRMIFLIRAGGFQRTLTQSPTDGGPAAFALSRVRPAVPGSLVRRVARRAGVSPGLVDYLVATRSPIEAAPYWVVFVKGGRGFYRARIDGTGLQRLG